MAIPLTVFNEDQKQFDSYLAEHAAINRRHGQLEGLNEASSVVVALMAEAGALSERYAALRDVYYALDAAWKAKLAS